MKTLFIFCILIVAVFSASDFKWRVEEKNSITINQFIPASPGKAEQRVTTETITCLGQLPMLAPENLGVVDGMNEAEAQKQISDNYKKYFNQEKCQRIGPFRTRQ